MSFVKGHKKQTDKKENTCDKSVMANIFDRFIKSKINEFLL